MRTYGQFCGVAKALDVVGDRWTLLIARDLLPGGRRYSDLLRGLPGITTNLLAKRLKEMTSAGLIEKVEEPPPSGSTVYVLTEEGRALKPVVLALGRFGHRYLDAPAPGEATSPRWAMVSLMRRYRGIDAPVVVALTVDGAPYTLALGEELTVTDGTPMTADLALGCDPKAFFALISKSQGARALARSGHLIVEGTMRDLARIARALDLRA